MNVQEVSNTMNLQEVEYDQELQQVLWACYECWKTRPATPDQRIISFTRIIDIYRDRFGTGFHQTKLYWLTKHGFLTQAHLVRGGARRYYKLVAPDKTLELLQKWNLA